MGICVMYLYKINKLIKKFGHGALFRINQYHEIEQNQLLC